MRRIFFLVTMLCALMGKTALAENELDIQAELSRPGVKLLVVEFYATWCKPCMKAVPEWKKLHKKYKKSGLRFIVVSADEGVCSKPPEWSPDESLCDADGVLQRKFEVANLPTSLLFSWEGNIAMRSHRVEPVEDAIESYFKDTTYKIKVDEPEVFGDKYAIGSNPSWVRDDVVARLQQRSKFDVVTASGGRIARGKSEVCSASFPANSVLRVKLTGDSTGERYLSLRLEKDDCVKASAQEAYKGKGFREDKASLRAAVNTAVDKILAQIITVRAPEDVDDGVRVQTFRNKFDDDGSTIKNPIVDEKGYLSVESEPEGATVFVNGEEMGMTPFVKELMVGDYVVLVKSGALWIPARKRVTLNQDGARLSMKLGPNYGILKVTSTPSGAEVWLDGEPTGQTTPYTFPMKKAGDYSLVLKKKMYLSHTVAVQLGNGKTVEIDERLEANFGSIRVSSTPSGASIIVDGQDSGDTTPATISPVRIGGREVTVRKASYNDFKKRVNVERGQTVEITATLTGQMGLLKVEAFIEEDGRRKPALGAKVSLNGEEMGKTPFKKRVLVGSYKVAVHSDDGSYEGDATVEEGKERKVEAVLLTGQMGWLMVEAFVEKNGRRKPVLGAKLSLNGEEVGRTPFQKRVLVGRYKVAVHSESGSYEGGVTVKKEEGHKIQVLLKSGGKVDVHGIEWVYSKPTKLHFMKTEATLGQFKACVRAGACKEKNRKTKNDNEYCNWGYSDRDEHPMNCVSWHGANDFCEWAGGRLPTEDEWYTEASNNNSREYPWGNQKLSCDYAIWGDGKVSGCGKDRTWPVCSKPKGNSVSGLCDMSGNVWEWTSTSGWFARVVRGGSWDYNKLGHLRASGRERNDPDKKFVSNGFRCVRLTPP